MTNKKIDNVSMKTKLSNILQGILPSILAILMAFIIGSVIIMLKGVNPLMAYGSMFKVAFYQTTAKYPFNGLAQTLVYATPIIFASLAVMISFKGGMFNIGVQGQMVAGGLGATIVGIYFKDYLPNTFVGITVALLVAMLFGFIWAGIAGILKSRFGVNEVISTIMLNYIMVNIQNYLLVYVMKDPNSANTQTEKVASVVRFPTFFQSITKQNLNLGLIIAILVVIIFYYFFKKTKLGYDIKAVGYNPTVAENAGINVKFIAFISMGIAGAVAGLGGAERILGGSTLYAYTEPIMGEFGFTGLAVALLGKNNPIGILFASIFYAALEIGGQTLQIRYGLDKEIVYIIQALIIIFVAAEAFFKMIVKKRKG